MKKYKVLVEFSSGNETEIMPDVVRWARGEQVYSIMWADGSTAEYPIQNVDAFCVEPVEVPDEEESV